MNEKRKQDKFFLKRKRKISERFNWDIKNSFNNKEKKKFIHINSKIKKLHVKFLKSFRKKKTQKKDFEKNNKQFLFLKKLNINLKKRESVNLYMKNSIFMKTPKIKHEEIIRENIIKMLIHQKKKKSFLYKKKIAIKENTKRNTRKTAKTNKDNSLFNFLNKDKKFSKKNRENHSLDLKNLNSNIFLKKKNFFYKKTRKNNLIKFIDKSKTKIFSNILETKVNKQKLARVTNKNLLAKNIFKSFQYVKSYNYYIEDDKGFILPEIGNRLNSFH